MKKLVLASFILASVFQANAQLSTGTGGATNVLPNSPTSNNNVGIGTNNPTAKLEVSGGLSNGTVFANMDEKFDKSLLLNVGYLVNGSTKYRNLRFFDFPQSNFDALPNVFFGIEDRNDYGRYRFVAETGGKTHMIVLDKTQTEVFKVYDDGNNNTTLILPKDNSFLGIGTTSFTDETGTYKLSVKGKIRAEEVRVYNTWADYVFANNYILKPLSEVEKYIKDNGHLQNVPSAKEVTENGLVLGDMARIQQEKIEELTLYIIELNKKLEAHEKKMQVLEAKINN
jgi:hypothetical protein